MQQPSEGNREVFARERQEYIARIVEEHGRARVIDLAEQFGVSTVTIRKDLIALEAEGRLVRAHGGAIAVTGNRPESAFEVRERVNREAKDAIGRVAAGMVVDGECIAFDASTTALAVARHLKARGGWAQLTVITNGLRIASELAGYPGITVAMPGGFVRWEALSVVGQLGDGVFQKVNVQKAFLGSAGFTLESGLSDATEEEAQIKRFMASSAREVIAIVDSSKWGRAAFATFCRTDDVTAVISDELAPEPMSAALRGRGVAVHLVSPLTDARATGEASLAQPRSLSRSTARQADGQKEEDQTIGS
jgi:DeoR family transcriptional regulator of aga operon/DeoR family fructose operon transcriptional repressor